jgi:hypothetical protein
MKFSKSNPCADHMLDPRWVSENGVWEIGVFPVMFGKRVRAGTINSPSCVVDYCAGGNDDFLKEILVTIIVILESFDESVKEVDIERILPTYKTKPINLDPCWAQLKKVALERHIAKTGSLTYDP